MKTSYTEFDVQTGLVRRRGICQEECTPAPQPGGAIILRWVDPWNQKVVCEGVDKHGRAINPRVMPAKRSRSKPCLPPEEDRPANITKGQYQQILARLTALENQSNPQGANRTVMFEDGIDKLPKETEP